MSEYVLLGCGQRAVVRQTGKETLAVKSIYTYEYRKRAFLGFAVWWEADAEQLNVKLQLSQH